jgi:hypothetical protein
LQDWLDRSRLPYLFLVLMVCSTALVSSKMRSISAFGTASGIHRIAAGVQVATPVIV